MKRKFWLLALIAMVLLSAAPVLADGDFYVVAGGGGVGTKISSLPYIITAPGFYYLSKNLDSTGNGITINASNVTIDLMGFAISGPGTSDSYGIYMNNQENVQIRNGTVTNFYNGIYAADSSNNDHRVISVRALYNKHYGIFLGGGDHAIQNCHASWNGSDGIESIGIVSNTIAQQNGGCGIGNAGLITNCTAAGNKGDGIVVSTDGQATTILNNVSRYNTGFGFHFADTSPILLDRNSARNNTAGNYSAGGTPTVWGLNAGR